MCALHLLILRLARERRVVVVHVAVGRQLDAPVGEPVHDLRMPPRNDGCDREGRPHGPSIGDAEQHREMRQTLARREAKSGDDGRHAGGHVAGPARLAEDKWDPRHGPFTDRRAQAAGSTPYTAR